MKKGSIIYTLGKVDSVSFRNSFLIVLFGFGFPWCSRYKLGVSFIPSCICQWCMCMCMLVCCLTVQLRLPFTPLFLSLASAVLTGVCHHSPLAIIFILFLIFLILYMCLCVCSCGYRCPQKPEVSDPYGARLYSLFWATWELSSYSL